MASLRTFAPLRATSALAATGLLIAACSSDETKPAAASRPDEITAIPFPTTIELGTADLGGMAPDTGDGTLTFDVAPKALDRVKVGSVIVGTSTAAAPKGLLRAVLAVERTGDKLVLKTGQAPIQVAYKKLHAHVSRKSAVADAKPSATDGIKPQVELASGSYDRSLPFNYVLFDGDSDVTTTNDQIATDGEIGGGFDYALDLDVDWGGIDALPDVVTKCLESFAKVLVGEPPSCAIDDLLPEAKVTFAVDPVIHANANVHGAAILEYEKSVDLASSALTPIVLGPLVLVPVVDLTAELSGGASAAFTTGIHGSAVFSTSVSVSSKQTQSANWRKPTLKSTDFGANETRITLHAEAKVGIGARLNVLLFGVTGPYATARAYGAVAADAFKNPCWSLHAGIETELGVKVTSPALPLLGHVTLVDWKAPAVNPLDLEITSGACGAPPDAPSLPPGSGPDAKHFATPSFTPWSRAYRSTADGPPTGPGNSVYFADQTRTIDGHYLRGGYLTKTLVKHDESGKVVWARGFDFENHAITPLRARPTRDGALMVASTSITAPLILSKIAQDGTMIESRGFDTPDCTATVTALTPDDAGGFWVVGTCIGEKSFVMHAAANETRWWTLSPNAPNVGLQLRVAERVGSDVFLSGQLRVEGDALYAGRFTPQGTFTYSKRYTACESAPDAIPSQAIVGPQGEVTIAGSGGAQHNGIVVRLLPNGAVGFTSFPGFGFGAGSVFLLDSIAELPTTGYVAGGSFVRLTGEAPEDTASPALLGLDASGKVLWAKRYTFGDPGSYRMSGITGVRLSDDGGVVASAFVSDPAEPLSGHLWAWKPFAKDGSISFSSGASSGPLAVANLECSLTATDRPLQVAGTTLAARPITVLAKPVQPPVTQQTTN